MIPLFWRYYSLISQIHSNSMPIIILYAWIMLIFFIWNNTLISLFHSLGLTILIFFRIIIIFHIFIMFIIFHTFPLIRNLNTLLFHYIFYTHTIYIFNVRIMLILFFWNLTIDCLNHGNSKSINVLFVWFYIFINNFFIIYSLLKPYLILLFTFISYPMIWNR